MGHHGSDEPTEEMIKALRAARDLGRDEKNGFIEELVKAENAPKFGATGQHPMGSLDKSDEGEIAFGVASHRGKVIINFGKPVAWLGMDARQAAGLAALLIQHANRCRDLGAEQLSEATAKEHAS